MILSPRLECILENTLANSPLADIGTDHALIPIELIKRGKNDKVIATDINKGPLERAEKEVEKNNLESRVELRIGAGLDPIKEDEVDQIVIAGMGGSQIVRILEDDFSKVENLSRLVLQPMTRIPELREYLLKNGFIILKEITVKEDRHFYQILVASKGKCDFYNTFDLEYGYRPALILDENFLDYIRFQRKLLKKRIENMQESKNEKTIRRRREFERRLFYLEEFYESIKNSEND